MFRNAYDGILEDWKIRLLTSHAKRFGLRREDLRDAQQQVVLELLQFEYDPHNDRGASEVTAVTALIDRRLAMFRRGEQRYRCRVDRQLVECPTLDYDPSPACDVSLDVSDAVRSLPPTEQQICWALAEGMSVHQVAQQLRMSWHTVRRHMERIRGHFEHVGLGDVRPVIDREVTAA